MEEFDFLVIGGGPGGYVGAIRAAQLGLKTACIESRGTLGGTCLNVGCIPSKALLHSSDLYKKAKTEFKNIGININEPSLDLAKMMSHKAKGVEGLTKGIEFLFKKNKITYIKGFGSFKDKNTISVIDQSNNQKDYKFKNAIIATGSVPTSLPNIEIDEKTVVSSTGALNLSSVPKKLVVVGGGYIGLEMGSVWLRLGAEVQVIEYLDYITPGMDREVSDAFLKILQKQGMQFNLSTKVISVKKNKNGATVTVEKSGAKSDINCDIVLMSVGRKPNTVGLNLDKIGVKLDSKGRIETDNKYKTNLDNIYAIGDVIDGPMLAHKAEEEGIAIAELLSGKSGHVNYNVIPGVIYTSPEVASVGKTEEQLKEQKISYKVGKFPFAANARAKINDEGDGFVKILADEKTDRVLGVHMIGPDAGNMIAEIALAMEFGASAEDIARTCHAHPTYAEAIKEAALAVDKRAIHF
ncbi:MAG: dihydrolipoyl dehydrogenase [Candidatus Fonsibacter sp.]|nr:dihydrolipoyl dehydrogenase [Candidatus Fonsibacter sp.]